MKRTLFVVPLMWLACTRPSTSSDCPTWYVDVDEDGYGDPDFPIRVCSGEVPAGLVHNGDDCHDRVADVHPGGEEVCDLAGFDEDCDGLVNDLDPDQKGGVPTWADLDGDGYGDPGSAQRLHCVVPADRSRDATDCNDDDASTYPGAAFEESDTICMTDEDDDGYGSVTPASGAAAGSDCDDGHGAVFPGAKEFVDDGVDEDCDGDVVDWLLMEDDFELGAPRPHVVPKLLNTEMTSKVARSGTWSVALPAFTNLVFREVDTRFDEATGEGCANLRWSFWARRGGAAAGESIALQGWDGVQFDDIVVIEGNGRQDPEFVHYEGRVDNPRAYHENLRLRIRASGYAPDAFFYVDDVRFVCSGIDEDGDGFGRNEDCDDSDARHWFDCATCVDMDGDGYGAPPDDDPKTDDSHCDLGNDDCDDTDPDRSPAEPDLFLDGLDQNCDRVDGPLLRDSFETGMVDTQVWSQVSGTWDYQTQFVGYGVRGLHLSGGAEGETVKINTLPCDEVAYSLKVKRGPSTPEFADTLSVSWYDGLEWITAFSLPGGSDSDLVRYRGIISSPLSLWVGFQARLTATGDAGDDWFVDDFAIVCNPVDADGDGLWDGVED